MSDTCLPESLLSFLVQDVKILLWYVTNYYRTPESIFLGGYFVRQLYVSPEFKVRLILSACGLSNLTKTYSSWFLLCFPSSALSPGLCLWAELYFTSQKQKTKKEWGGVGDGVDIFILRAEVVIFWVVCLLVLFLCVSLQLLFTRHSLQSWSQTWSSDKSWLVRDNRWAQMNSVR